MPETNLPPSAAAALGVAREAFGQMDAADACRRTGAAFDQENNQYLLPCLGGTARIGAVDCSLQWDTAAQAKFHLVLLHYLMFADGSIPKGERLSLFEAAPTGSAWADRMLKSCIPPLAAVFGDDLESFFSSVLSLGGEKLSADTAVLHILPHLPIYITIWGADEEFPADARVLLDKTLPGQLPGEDRLVIAEFAVLALLQASGKLFSMPSIGESK